MDKTTVPTSVIEKFKEVENILITVNANPTVDELSAALALTLVANKLEKHATAVFSGAVPRAIEFLEPNKTFEDNVNSLRDFIIALDKEKADHLRYKLVGDYVKIFITPYRYSLSESDLEFSLGDYNVECVFAVGVQSESDLDAALAEHGRIVHDAAVIPMSVADDESSLDGIKWHDKGAQSYCELVMAFAEKMKDKKSLLDEQVATALMTGIVATTERFRNEKTTSQNMNMAARLMAAGANQQLIAAKLEVDVEEKTTVSEPAPQSVSDSENSSKGAKSSELNVHAAIKQNARAEGDEDVEEELPAPVAPAPQPKNDTQLNISHEYNGDLDDVARQVEQKRQQKSFERAQQELATLQDDHSVLPPPVGMMPPVQPLAQGVSGVHGSSVNLSQQMPEPSFGGTLNATSEQAEADKRRMIESDKNKTILSHRTPGSSKYVGGSDEPIMAGSPLNSIVAGTDEDDAMSYQPLDMTEPPRSATSAHFAGDSLKGLTLEEIEQKSGSHQPTHPPTDARAAVQAALEKDTLMKNGEGLPPLPAFPQAPPPQHVPPQFAFDDFGRTTPPPHSELQAPVNAHQPDLGAPLPPLPPMPDMSTLPPMPSQPAFGQGLPPLPPIPQQPTQPAPADPAQFRIPS